MILDTNWPFDGMRKELVWNGPDEVPPWGLQNHYDCLVMMKYGGEETSWDTEYKCFIDRYETAFEDTDCSPWSIVRFLGKQGWKLHAWAIIGPGPHSPEQQIMRAEATGEHKMAKEIRESMDFQRKRFNK